MISYPVLQRFVLLHQCQAPLVSTNAYFFVCSELLPTTEAAAKTSISGAGEEPRAAARMAIILPRNRELLPGLGSSFIPSRARAWVCIVAMELVNIVKYIQMYVMLLLWGFICESIVKVYRESILKAYVLWMNMNCVCTVYMNSMS